MCIEIDHANLICPRNSTGPTHGHPEFAKANGLPRFQKRIRLLVAEEPRLHFNIGAVVVGERRAPVKIGLIDTP